MTNRTSGWGPLHSSVLLAPSLIVMNAKFFTPWKGLSPADKEFRTVVVAEELQPLERGSLFISF